MEHLTLGPRPTAAAGKQQRGSQAMGKTDMKGVGGESGGRQGEIRCGGADILPLIFCLPGDYHSPPPLVAFPTDPGTAGAQELLLSHAAGSSCTGNLARHHSDFFFPALLPSLLPLPSSLLLCKAWGRLEIPTSLPGSLPARKGRGDGKGSGEGIQAELLLLAADPVPAPTGLAAQPFLTAPSHDTQL